jgi:uncharacterized protein YcgL (UPF0745 family)
MINIDEKSIYLIAYKIDFIRDKEYNKGDCFSLICVVVFLQEPNEKGDRMSRKLIKEEFVEKANKVHEGKSYTYEKFIYVNNETNGTISCPEHDDFSQIPDSHLSGRGCPVCGKNEKSKKQRSTKEEFVERVKKVHEEKGYTYEKFIYVNNKTKGTITCPKHGDFSQIPHNHLGGSGCPNCGKNKRSKK